MKKTVIQSKLKICIIMFLIITSLIIGLVYASEYDLEISFTGSGTMYPYTGTGSYEEGTNVPVFVVPDSGWSLSYWLLDSVNVGSAIPYTVTMDDDHTITAVFTETPPDDTTPPTGLISINGGAATTDSVEVTLTFSATDTESGVVGMQIVNVGESWTTWLPYSEATSWTLPSDDGTKTVSVRFLNGDGVVSSVYSDTITLNKLADIQTVDSVGDVGMGSSLAFDSSGNPCISYYDATNKNLKYAQWTGSSWNIQSIGSTDWFGMYPSLAFDSSGNPCISFWGFNALKYATKTGLIWIIQTVDTSQDVGRYCSLAFDSSGNPGISYYDAYNDNLKYATKTGIVWSIQTVDSAGSVGEYTSLAFDSSGNPGISYYDHAFGALKFARWTGSSWNIQTVDSTGDVGADSSLAFDSSNNPCISYYDWGMNQDLKYATKNGLLWNKQTVDSWGSVGAGSSLAFDSGGNPCISYRDNSNGALKFARWTGSSWNIQTVDSKGNVGGYTSLAFDSSNNPCISYYDFTNEDLKYAQLHSEVTSRDTLWNRLVEIILAWPTSTAEQRAVLWEEIVEIILLWPTAP